MSPRIIARAEVLLIVFFACVPLFIHLSYRVNIFLSWEGAYRMSQGQLPFRDFGLPLGGMYWVIPAIFFKLFFYVAETFAVNETLLKGRKCRKDLIIKNSIILNNILFIDS